MNGYIDPNKIPEAEHAQWDKELNTLCDKVDDWMSYAIQSKMLIVIAPSMFNKTYTVHVVHNLAGWDNGLGKLKEILQLSQIKSYWMKNQVIQ